MKDFEIMEKEMSKEKAIALWVAFSECHFCNKGVFGSGLNINSIWFRIPLRYAVYIKLTTHFSCNTPTEISLHENIVESKFHVLETPFGEFNLTVKECGELLGIWNKREETLPVVDGVDLRTYEKMMEFLSTGDIVTFSKEEN